MFCLCHDSFSSPDQRIHHLKNTVGISASFSGLLLTLGDASTLQVPLGPPPVRDPDLLGAPSEAAEAAEAEAATPLPRCCYPGLRCEAGQRQYKILITQGERKATWKEVSRCL